MRVHIICGKEIGSMLPGKKKGGTPWSSGTGLANLFTTAQKEKNNANEAAKLADIEKQMEALTFGSKGATAPSKMASPGLQKLFGSSSSSSAAASSSSALGSGQPVVPQNSNKKALAKFHQQYLNRITNVEKSATWKPTNNGTTYQHYMNVAYPGPTTRNNRGQEFVMPSEVKQRQNIRNAKTLVDLAPYMDPEYQEKYKNKITAAKGLLGVKGRKNRKTRKERKNRKMNTRKNRR